MASFGQASPALLGLDFLSTKSADQFGSPALHTPKNTPNDGFEPSSTQRAKKRAEFEEKKKMNQYRRRSRDFEEREKKVKELHKELDTLREKI